MDRIRRLRLLSTLVATTSLVAACGGGGGSDSASPPPPSNVTISGKAVDGPLQGATACLDTSDNRACDSGEPTSAATGIDGGFTISGMTAAQAGAHRVIVVVPATAIDADTGAAVGTAFTMVAPASASSGSQSVFVSPLTTLVAQQMDASGQTRSEAAAFIQQQAGLAVSPLADFSAASNTDNAKAANVAKLALQTSLQQSAAVASALGQTDVSGTVITQVDLDRAVLDKVVAALPVIGAAAVDPAIVNLSGSAREQALAAAATTVVGGIGFTPEQARFEIGIPRIPQPPAAAPAAGANVAALQYTDAANWFFRYNAATAADNTPDANGLLRYYSVRTRMAPYAFEPTQGVAESTARTSNPELHWSGSAWTACTVTDRQNATPRDALGRSGFDACRNIEKGFNQRAEIDIGGQGLADVWTNRLLVEQAKTTNPAAWSLPSTALLGSGTFPAGSRLLLQSNTVTETAITYNTSASNRVDVAPLAVAQGGDARNASPACATDSSRELLGTLETLVARNLGQPCVFNQQTNDANGPSLTPNEVWGTSTVSMGTLATNAERPAGTANYYTANRLLRVSFPSAGSTAYWSCLQRTTNNASRNCTQIGSGSYTIATLGDARVMTFNNLPAAAQGLNSTRVFVERNGAIYFGFKNRVGQKSSTVRLNMTAANAVLSQLGMPLVQPVDAPQPLTGAKATNAALLEGVWAQADANGAAVLRFGPNGEYLMAQATPPDGSGRPGLEEGYVDFDLAAAQQVGLVLNTDSNNQWGFSHPIPDDRIVSITDTAITLGDATVISRLADDPNGIVGMWALGSTTNLKTTHFVFFANGKVLSIHPAETQGSCATARQGPPGIEWSDYTFTAGTGALRFFNKVHDTSGCTGAFDSAQAVPDTERNLVLTIAADGKTATFLADDGVTVLTLYRITPNP